MTIFILLLLLPETEQPSIPVPSSTTTDKEEFGKGVVFYLRDSKVVGILLWNIFGRMAVARRVSLKFYTILTKFLSKFQHYVFSSNERLYDLLRLNGNLF